MRSTVAMSAVSFALAGLCTCVPGRAVISAPLAPAPRTAQPADAAALATEARAVWIWGSTVRAQGAEATAESLRGRGITDAILLVKGTGGTVAYPSAYAPPAAASDTLGEFVTACHARGIRVHAWLNYHQDDSFGKAKNYAYSIWHVARMPAVPYQVKDGRICPLRAQEEYNGYFLGIVNEILARYPVDGIHLDYIRYPHVVYCFCPAHQQAAAAQGIDVARLRTLLNQTLYTPGDQKTYFDALAAGDPDVVKWVGMRTAEIAGVVHSVREAVDAHNRAQPAGRQVLLSAATMPEGALAESAAYGLCHYSQSYERLSPDLAVIAPMAYHKDYGKPPSWVGEVVSGAAAKAPQSRIWAGIQVYAVTAEAIADAVASARWNGAAGIALFRAGYSATAEQAWGRLVPTIDSLGEATRAAGDAGWIDEGVLTSLDQKLRNAARMLGAGNAGAAANQVDAYVNELEAQQGKHVDARAAHALAADAAWLLDVLPPR